MPAPDYRFRVDAARAAYVIGEFCDDLLRHIIPRIVELRSEPDKPFSVIINSLGGDSNCLDALVSALGVKDCDGGSSRVVTSVVGQAASAGAILLTLGDYAIANPNSLIYFHGVRRADDEITVERARKIASNLALMNRGIANHVSQMMFPRVVHRFVRLKKNIEKYKKRINEPKMPMVVGYANISRGILSQNRVAVKILDQSIKRLARVKQVGYLIRNLNIYGKISQARKDASVLTKIIENAVIDHKKEKRWAIDEDGLQSIVADYMLLREFSFGEHNHTLGFYTQVYGPDFLSKPKFKIYINKKKKSEKEAFKYLIKEVATDVSDFWYLTVSISRFMFQGENPLSAHDAYWLGIIDEITGDPEAFGIREIMEKKIPSSPSSTLPPPPSPQSPTAVPS